LNKLEEMRYISRKK